MNGSADRSNVVVWSPRWLGDAILSAPALSALQKSSWVGRMDILGAEPHREIYSLLGLGTNFLAHEPRSNLVSRIRENNYDLGILLPRSFRSAYVLKRAGVPLRYGAAAEGRGIFLTKIFTSRDRHEAHLGAEFLDWSVQAGAEQMKGILAQEVEEVFEPLRLKIGRKPRGLPPAVVLHTGSAFGPAKRWPLENFVGLAKRLSKEGVRVMVLGTKSESALGAALAEQAGVVDATGQTSMKDLMDLMSLADVFVGNDSGPLHLAAALGLSVIGIYGSTSPRWTAPWSTQSTLFWGHTECSPCFQKTCAVNTRCLSLISTDRVHREVLNYLKNGH